METNEFGKTKVTKEHVERVEDTFVRCPKRSVRKATNCTVDCATMTIVCVVSFSEESTCHLSGEGKNTHNVHNWGPGNPHEGGTVVTRIP